MNPVTDHCDDVMQRILSFVALKCAKLVNKKWYRLSTLNESTQQRRTNQMVREYQSMFLAQIKSQIACHHTIVVDRDSQQRNIGHIIRAQCRDGDRIMVHDGHYELKLDGNPGIDKDIRIVGAGDVSFITSMTDLLVIRGSVYFENITFQNLRMVVYGDLFLKNCRFKFSSRSGRFVMWMIGGTLKYLGCEFAGIDGLEMIDHGLSRNVDFVGCRFVSCGKRRAQRAAPGKPGEREEGEHGTLNCVGNVFENNSVFPVMGVTRKVVGAGNILRGHNGFTINDN